MCSRAQALNEALEARMRIMGESSVLSSFEDFFKDRQLTSGTQVLLLWRTADNTLEVKLLPSSSVEYAAVCSDITQVHVATSGLNRSHAR